jgi:hypothetical protein
MITGFWGSTPAREADAKACLEVLQFAYPGHPWFVKVYEGVIFIKWLYFDSSYGMALKTKNISHDAAVFKRELIFMAGEWLERAGLARKRYEDQDVDAVAGVPGRKTVVAPKILEPSSMVLRETPRPQAVKNG